MATDLECPGYRGERAAHYLFNGEIQLAFIQNKAIVILSMIALIYTIIKNTL